MRLAFIVPARGLFGYRSEFMTDTRGEGVMSSVFEGYEPFRGDVPARTAGALVAFETGETTAYGLHAAQERGTMFIGPGVPVYAGMVIGVSSRPGDIDVNACRKKHVTNTRNAASAEDSLRLISVKPMSLEECLEFIAEDELLEVTPKSLRMRKRTLGHEARMRAASRKKG
jgi:GTP-binding protein